MADARAEDPGMTEADRALIHAAQTGEGLVEVTPGMLSAMVEAAGRSHSHFGDMVQGMTREQAAYVRRLRVDEGYSWRAVAETCHAEWAGRWEPPSNQIMGIAICEKAASFWGEDAWTGVWNG